MSVFNVNPVNTVLMQIKENVSCSLCKTHVPGFKTAI